MCAGWKPDSLDPVCRANGSSPCAVFTRTAPHLVLQSTVAGAAVAQQDSTLRLAVQTPAPSTDTVAWVNKVCLGSGPGRVLSRGFAQNGDDILDGVTTTGQNLVVNPDKAAVRTACLSLALPICREVFFELSWPFCRLSSRDESTRFK